MCQCAGASSSAGTTRHLYVRMSAPGSSLATCSRTRSASIALANFRLPSQCLRADLTAMCEQLFPLTLQRLDVNLVHVPLRQLRVNGSDLQVEPCDTVTRDRSVRARQRVGPLLRWVAKQPPFRRTVHVAQFVERMRAGQL